MHFFLCMSYDHLCNVMGEMSTYTTVPEAVLPKIVIILAYSELNYVTPKFIC